MSGLLGAQPCRRSFRQIEDVAEAFAADHGFVAGASSVRELVRALGGRVEVIHDADYEKELEGGSLEVHGPGDFLIKLSPVTGPLRDNFTMAHELGHYVLHSGDPYGARRIKVGRWGRDLVEQQANRFAAALLMPRAAFLGRAKHYRNDPTWLASWFQVSLLAADVRLKSLVQTKKVFNEMAA